MKTICERVMFSLPGLACVLSLAALFALPVNADEKEAGEEYRGELMHMGPGFGGGMGYMMGREEYGMHMGPRWREDLSDAQERQIEQKGLAAKRTQNLLRATLKLRKAELNDLLTQDSPDKEAVHAKIDEVVAVIRKMMVAQYDHKLDVRQVLSEEQRILYDTRLLGRGEHGWHGGHYDARRHDD